MFLPTCIIVCMGPLSFGKLKLFFVLHCAWSENYCFQSLLSREKTRKRKSVALPVLDRIIALRKFRGRRICSQRTCLSLLLKIIQFKSMLKYIFRASTFFLRRFRASTLVVLNSNMTVFTTIKYQNVPYHLYFFNSTFMHGYFAVHVKM